MNHSVNLKECKRISSRFSGYALNNHPGHLYADQALRKDICFTLVCYVFSANVDEVALSSKSEDAARCKSYQVNSVGEIFEIVNKPTHSNIEPIAQVDQFWSDKSVNITQTNSTYRSLPTCSYP